VSVSRHVLHLLQGFAKVHDLAGQRLLMIPPLQFDASVGDIFPCAGLGCHLVLHGAAEPAGAAELAAYCARHAVTAIDAPAALWRRWTDASMAPPAPRQARAARPAPDDVRRRSQLRSRCAALPA
jgi:hypothetical protein